MLPIWPSTWIKLNVHHEFIFICFVLGTLVWRLGSGLSLTVDATLMDSLGSLIKFIRGMLWPRRNIWVWRGWGWATRMYCDHHHLGSDFRRQGLRGQLECITYPVLPAAWGVLVLVLESLNLGWAQVPIYIFGTLRASEDLTRNCAVRARWTGEAIGCYY